ncbi:hypothetical protein GCM10010276_60240 [Streptomyces longisporus]|uniref:Uncharacterized protein n=1 Tax=Streptomyces longisporus TaxID=1948 RepID=A0ABP6A2T4_STRLO
MWGRTGRVSFRTCETVATETPALRATSAMVAIASPFLGPAPFDGTACLPAGTVSHPRSRVNACANVYVA